MFGAEHSASRRFFGLSVSLLSLIAACSKQDSAAPSIPRQSCASAFWAIPASESSAVQVIGSWDSWQQKTTLAPYQDAPWWLAQISLPPGDYGYQIIDAGVPGLDPYQAQTTFHDGVEVSLLRVTDCNAASLSLSSVTIAPDGSSVIQGTYIAAADGNAIATLTASVPATFASDADTGAVTITVPPGTRGKNNITVSAVDDAGHKATAKAAVWFQPAQETSADGIIYQIMIDRYRGDGGVALSPPATPGSRAGGTLDGVRAELDRGTFDSLGVTTIWLSPVYTNPDEARLGLDGHMYEGYHGYWPAQSRQVDPRLGGEDALHAVVSTAHSHGIRVILDIVPNHVYETNPRYLAAEGSGYFNDGADKCVCGVGSCDWGSHILSCWFASYLPDVNYQNTDAMRDAEDDAVWFQDTFDLDGVRIDAVPMIPRAASRRITHALRTSMAPRDARFSIGEVFTGDDSNGVSEIKYYLGPDGLDAAFDFPLMWSLRSVVAQGTAGWGELDQLLASENTALDGSGSLLGRMLGNHDTTRFASVSNGDAAGDPWADPPSSVLASDVIAKQRIAFSYVMTLPGIPVVYYGDEIALPGGGDPDSRRVMPAADALSDAQRALLADVSVLGRLRACEPALRRGTRTVLASTKTTTSYLRTLDGEESVLVVLSTDTQERDVFVGKLPANNGSGASVDWIDALSGETVTLSGDDAATVSVPAQSVRVLVPSSSRCATH